MMVRPSRVLRSRPARTKMARWEESVLCGAPMASAINPGTDLALFNAWMTHIADKGWVDKAFRIDGRPTAQWSRLKAGHSDDLSPGSR